MPPIKNNMEHQRGSSNLDTIITHNLSETYLVLMIQNYPNNSSNINEIIRPVLNFFFLTIRFHKYKKKHQKVLKSTKKYHKALKNTTNWRFISLKFIDIRFISLKFTNIRFISLKFIDIRFMFKIHPHKIYQV